jgi:rhomboid protease GluP
MPRPRHRGCRRYTGGILAVRVVSQRPRPRGWAAVLAVVGAVLAAGAWLFPDVVGYVGLALWLLLVLFPSVGQRQALRLASTRRSGFARRLARIVTWLHPADGWPETRLFVDALAALQQGRAEEGQALLLQLRNSRSSLSRTALALQVRLSGDWAGYLHWVETHPHPTDVLADNSLLDAYLQALGETGHRHLMLSTFADREDVRDYPPAQLHIAALCGDVATTQELLAGPLQGWPDEVADLWRATARQAAGDSNVIRDLERLAASPNLLVAGTARRRLEQPLSPLSASDFDDAAQAALAELRRDARHEAQFAVMSSTPYRRPVVTLVIAALMTINFFRELPGGSQHEQNLVDMGAVVIPGRWEREGSQQRQYDEWWRPITAAFLHFGWPHFLMNLFGLLYLGTRLERAWGPWRTLICYAAAVLVSMSATPWLMERSDEGHVLAGASGGIMGLMGGLLGYLLIGRFRRHTPQVARQLTLLLGFVALQTTFDFTHEQVSYQAHLLGLATGVVLGMLFGLAPTSPRPASRPPAMSPQPAPAD